jgi:diguanylate cyclase (GGDEF)-like protein
MQDFRPTQLLVLCRDAVLAERLAVVLADAGTVYRRVDDLPAGPPADVIVTDLAEDELTARLGRTSGRRTGLPGGTGLVGMGVNLGAKGAGAYISLPLDCSDRELQLACRAVAQIARLRVERDELTRIHQEATHLAETDPLTGLANRRAWNARLPAMLARVARSGESLWLALVDLDSFKTINDRDGMAHGDRVLTSTGQALLGGLRRSDLVARLGGDEFGVLLVNTPAERVLGVLDRLRAAVEAAGQVTASIGYVAAREGATPSEMLAAAEQAMRAAKRAGGNRIECGEK